MSSESRLVDAPLASDLECDSIVRRCFSLLAETEVNWVKGREEKSKMAHYQEESELGSVVCGCVRGGEMLLVMYRSFCCMFSWSHSRISFKLVFEFI